MERDGPN